MADLGGGELAIVTGSSAGALSRLRMTAPMAPGSDPSEIQVRLCRKALLLPPRLMHP